MPGQQRVRNQNIKIGNGTDLRNNSTKNGAIAIGDHAQIDDYVMQENYAEFYADPIRKYQKSRHIFDEETTVQDIVKKQIAMGENMADNFKFVKSETDIFVQLSDVVAGILGKLFKYINSTSVNQRRRDVEGLSKLQVENILLIDKLRMEADRENPGFLCSIGPGDGIGILNRFFEMVKSRKEK